MTKVEHIRSMHELGKLICCNNTPCDTAVLLQQIDFLTKHCNDRHNCDFGHVDPDYDL